MAPGLQRLGYVHASPLVQRRGKDGRRVRMDQLGTHEELKMIRKKLGESGRQIRFRAEVAKIANLRQLLNSGCRMLHYTGHGNSEFLAFESNRSCGIMEPLHVEPLKNLFQAGGVTTQLVFISSCSSELSGNAFVEAGVPHVVAVKREVSVTDQAAQQFANQFYDALLSQDGRYTVKQAYDIALNTVNADNTNAPPQGDHFLLLPAEGNHDVRIFDTLPEGDFSDETRPLPPRPPCPKPVPFYKGLEALQKVVENLVDPTAACVTITGEHGSGKTEMAIQACEYVRLRYHFESVLWADVKRAVADATASFPDAWAVYDDPCWLIGVALGMPQPGPKTEDELTQFLFKNPTREGGRRCDKVLLVLENVDSLFEGGGDARDRLVNLLSTLCSYGEHLKLLVTSEQSLLRDTNERFRHGAEKVVKVGRLWARDAAQLLLDKIPTRFTKKELGLPADCTREDILRTLVEHEVLKAADGHPGTLLRLAPLLEDHKLNDPRVLQRVKRHRVEYQTESAHRPRTNSRASSTNSLVDEAAGVNGGGFPGTGSDVGLGFTGPGTPTHLVAAFSHDTHLQQQHHHHHQQQLNGNPSTYFHEGPPPPGWAGQQPSTHPLLNGSGMAMTASSSVPGPGSHASSSQPPSHQRRHSAHPVSPTRPLAPQQQHQRRMTLQDHRQAMQELAVQELEEPDPPQMTQEEKKAWDTARTAGLMNRGCRLVWVKASANAAADGWKCTGAGGSGWGAGAGAGSVGGWSVGTGEEVTRYDCVPWEYLKQGLMQHLCGKLTIPSSRDEVVDDGPYAWAADEFGLGSDAGGGAGEGGGYGAVNTPQIRWMNEEELAFVRGVLKSKQEKVRARQERLRKQHLASRGYDGTELGGLAAEASGGGRGRGSAGGGGSGGGGSGDIISLDAFFEFSQWWAPLMETLSLLKNDWSSTDPIRVHGFIGRLAAERQLRQSRRGTFLLRFSESKPGWLVVSFTEHVKQAPGGFSHSSSPPSGGGGPGRPRPASVACVVKHCLVEVRTGGRCYIEVEAGSKVPYNSLHALVRACSSMQTLYPDVPKEEAFYEGLGGGGGDTGISMHQEDMVREVVTLEEWGSRPIEMVFADGGDLDDNMTLAAPV